MSQDSTHESYFSRSWALLTRERGWWKILLLVGLSYLVPIVGALGVLGYALEWSRLVAWGRDVAPKQKGVRVGECISSGWRGFVAMLGWAVLWEAVAAWLTSRVGDGSLMGLLTSVASILVFVITTVCALRATIYQRFTAGYQANRIWDMLKSDFGGIVRIAAMNLIVGLVAGVVLLVLGAALLMPEVLTLVMRLAMGSGSADMVGSAFLSAARMALPALLLLIYAAAVINGFATLLSAAAVGLWVRNFNVPAWGASADPLPKGPSLPAGAPPAAPGMGASANAVPTQGERRQGAQPGQNV